MAFDIDLDTGILSVDEGALPYPADFVLSDEGTLSVDGYGLYSLIDGSVWLYDGGIYQQSRNISVRATITYPDGNVQALSAEDIVSFVVSHDLGKDFPLGATPAAALTMKLSNADREWDLGGIYRKDRIMDGANIQVEVGAAEYDGTFAWESIGHFAIERFSAQEQQTYADLSASDAMANNAMTAFEDEEGNYPRTIASIYADAIVQSGMVTDSATFLNSDIVIEELPVWTEGITCRSVLGYCAACAASACIVNRDGRVGMVPLGINNGHIIKPDRYITLTRSEAEFGPLNAVIVLGAGENDVPVRFAADIDKTDTAQNSLGIEKNPLMEAKTLALHSIGAGVASALIGLSFVGGEVHWPGDFDVSLGDLVTVIDLNEKASVILISLLRYEYQTGLRMVGACTLTSETKQGALRQQHRVFTASGALNASALAGDIRVEPGESLLIERGGDMRIKAGGSIALEPGSDLVVKPGGGVHFTTNDFSIRNALGQSMVSVQGAENGGGNLVIGDVGAAVAFGGNFILGLENGGTGESRPRTHRGAVRPVADVGEDGDIYVFYNGVSEGISYSDINIAPDKFATPNIKTYFGRTRNWNFVQAGSYLRIGNGIGGISYYYGTYFSFTAPGNTRAVQIEFYTTKAVGGSSLSSGTTAFMVYCVKGGPTSSAAIASARCSASAGFAKQTIILSPSGGFTYDEEYSVGVCFPNTDIQSNGAAIRHDGATYRIMLKGMTGVTGTHGLFIKSRGAWQEI